MNIQKQLPIHKVGVRKGDVVISACGVLWTKSDNVKETTAGVTCRTCLSIKKVRKEGRLIRE